MAPKRPSASKPAKSAKSTIKGKSPTKKCKPQKTKSSVHPPDADAGDDGADVVSVAMRKELNRIYRTKLRAYESTELNIAIGKKSGMKIEPYLV